MANLRYLALHRIPETLEKLTKSLMQERPVKPLPYMVKQLTEMRIANKTKNIEEFIKTHSNDPNFRFSCMLTSHFSHAAVGKLQLYDSSLVSWSRK